jgi:hypothetical protein
MALKHDGTAVAWPTTRYNQHFTNVAKVDCGSRTRFTQGCAILKNDHTVFYFNMNFGMDAHLSGGVELTNITEVSCGGAACVAVKNDQTAVAWPTTRYAGRSHGIPVVMRNGRWENVDMTNVAEASCGGHACVALKNDGTVVAWGDPRYGGDQSGVDLTNVATVSCGAYTCVALKNDDTAVAWGSDSWEGDLGTSLEPSRPCPDVTNGGCAGLADAASFAGCTDVDGCTLDNGGCNGDAMATCSLGDGVDSRTCTCATGYSGSSSTLADADSFNGCTVNTCTSAPGPPANGSVSFSSSNDHASTATFSCNTGFTLFGNASVTCDAATDKAAWPAASNVPSCASRFQPPAEVDFAVSHEVVFCGISATAFNSDSKIAKSFRQTIANLLNVPQTDVYNIKASVLHRQLRATAVVNFPAEAWVLSVPAL